MNKWLKPTRPENEPILCPYTLCAHGMGQAGAGRCPGDWTNPDCEEFITQEDYEKQMEENCARFGLTPYEVAELLDTLPTEKRMEKDN